MLDWDTFTIAEWDTFSVAEWDGLLVGAAAGFIPYPYPILEPMQGGMSV